MHECINFSRSISVLSSVQKEEDTCFWFQHIRHRYSPVHPCKCCTAILNVLKNRTYTNVIERKGTAGLMAMNVSTIDSGRGFHWMDQVARILLIVSFK